MTRAGRRPPPGASDRTRRGFILIETLAALTIFAAVVTAVFVAVQGAARGDSEARFRALAATVARSALEVAGVETPLADGEVGSLDAAGIQVVVRATCDRNGKEPAGLVGCWLTAVATDPEGRPGRSLTLRTYRLSDPGGP